MHDRLYRNTSLTNYFLPRKVEDVGKAHPKIVETVETMLQKGKWTVPGACCNFSSLSCILHRFRSQGTRRSSGTSTSCKHLLLSYRIYNTLSDRHNMNPSDDEQDNDFESSLSSTEKLHCKLISSLASTPGRQRLVGD